jgi:thiamine-monophosphate kinase
LRIGLGQRLAALRGVGAAIDVSDGLVQDLGHVCKASRVSAAIDVSAVPVAEGAARSDALFGGDDYELLFTARTGAASHRGVTAACRAEKCRAVAIGRIVPRRGAIVFSSDDGHELSGGFSHFSNGGRA